jgi:diaminohydroxyphosphoribosylaminopyrimidine deaminase/5-amino-6-(5-phosphoribosylamino)uracil reductase
MSTHDSFMIQAIGLSMLGFPAPNPRVGCVIVNEGEIVGRGYCAYDGADHAEVMALKDAGNRSKGATAYVTLEPCNHFGKTPPCSHALIKAGIETVVFAIADPNPVAAGGADYLRDRGVQVIEGCQSGLAAKANLQFLFAMQQRRPMVTVKAGMTLDGKVAMSSGESKWITNESSRLDAMRLRAEIGCVMVGRVTAEVDQAKLTIRGLDGANQPLRVVIDPQGKLDPQLPIFDDSAQTLHLTNQLNIDTPAEILERIWEKKQTGVLIEGGPTTSAHFMRSGLVDQVVLYMAPKIFGEGKSWIGPFGLSEMRDSHQFELVDSEIIDGDIKLTYRSWNLQTFLASYNL